MASSQSHNNETPLISIGIPTYNRAHAISDAIISVQKQGITDLELIISDNASPDNTEEVVQSFAKDDPRIKYYRQDTNIGPQANFSFTQEKARGKYFMWLSDDDELVPDLLNRYVQFMEANPEYVLVSGEIKYWIKDKLIMVETDLGREEKSPLLRSFKYYFNVRHGAFLHGLQRRSVSQQVPLRSVIGNDWHFVASMAHMGKVKQLHFDGYNKDFEGGSRSFINYARNYGERKIWGYLPYSKIALDVFREYAYMSPVLRKSNLVLRILAGTTLAIWVNARAYLYLYPKVFFQNYRKVPKKIISILSPR